MAKVSKRMRAMREKIEVGKLYSADEAFNLLAELSSVKFPEAVDAAKELQKQFAEFAEDGRRDQTGQNVQK